MATARPTTFPSVVIVLAHMRSADWLSIFSAFGGRPEVIGEWSE
jgi:hypothetical protein